VAVAPEAVARALAAPPDAWLRIGDGAPSAPAPKVDLALSIDEMSATLTLGAPVAGGRAFEPDEVVALLHERRITVGIDRAAIEEALESERYDAPIVVARGEPPGHGADATVRYHFRTDKSHVHLTEDAHGQIDFHELGLFEDVTLGQVLVEKVPPQPRGRDGRTVTGIPLPARDGGGVEVPLKGGKNTQLSEDGRTLSATVAGQVLFSAGVASVEPVLLVKGNVDFKTGNIDSRGSVVVRGDVTEGFHVHADGNLEVHGLVEAANLSAHGDVVIHRGVLGRGAATIAARGDVFAKFLDQVTVRAGRDAIVSGEILTSDVTAGRQVTCAAMRGGIVGGEVTAGDTITAASIGSRIGIPTFVTAGLSVVGRVVFAGVRLTVNGAHLEVLDPEHGIRFVEKDGVVVRESV
jgi:uncharacterized protein (DUF342 family)